MKKTLLISILILTSFFFIIPAFAQNTEVRLLEPSVLGGAGDQASPPFTDYISKIFTQILIVAAVLAVLMIVIGGLQYITSFSVGSKEDGRKRMTQAVIGLILAIAAWLILNTINGSLTDVNVSLQNVPAPPLYAGPQYGPNGDPSGWGKCLEYGFRSCYWATTVCGLDENIAPNQACRYPGNESTGNLLCCGVRIPAANQQNYLIKTQNAGTPDERRCYVDVYEDQEKCHQANAAQNVGGQCVEASIFHTLDDGRGASIRNCLVVERGEGWEYQGGIERQLGDASPEVLNMMSCLREKLGVKIFNYKISSISDSNHIGRLNECRVPGASNCAHGRTSDHYGDGDNKSHAIDIVPDGASGSPKDGPTTDPNAIPLGNQIEAYARECGATKTVWQSEGHYNHVHISTP